MASGMASGMASDPLGLPVVTVGRALVGVGLALQLAGELLEGGVRLG